MHIQINLLGKQWICSITYCMKKKYSYIYLVQNVDLFYLSTTSIKLCYFYVTKHVLMKIHTKKSVMSSFHESETN